jgi:hypothetical protein
MIFDDSLLNFYEMHFVKCDWTKFYQGGAEEVEPHNTPELQGKSVNHVYIC